jgi:hypothetical protein
MIYFITLCDKKSFEQKRTYFLEKSFQKYYQNKRGEENEKEGEVENIIILQTYLSHHGKYNKIVQVYNYLRINHQIKDDDVILFIDGFDTLVMKPFDSNEVETDFRASGKDIIFGADNEFKYIYDEARAYYDERYSKVGSQKYLNSSFYIGYKRSILQLFQYIMGKLVYYPKPDGKMNDRRILGYVFYQAHSKNHSSTNKVLEHLVMDIDYECKYFYTKNVDKGLGELLVRNPYFLHFPHLENPSQKSAYILVAKLKDLI